MWAESRTIKPIFYIAIFDPHYILPTFISNEEHYSPEYDYQIDLGQFLVVLSCSLVSADSTILAIISKEWHLRSKDLFLFDF